MIDESGSDLQQSYRASGFARPIGFGVKPALIVIDMAKAYFTPGAPLYAGVESTVPVCATLIAAMRAGGHSIVHTRVEYQPGGADGGHFYRKIAGLASFDRGNPLADPIAELAPAPGDILVTKQYASAFFGTSLAATLNALRVDTCLISGVTTSGCVRATALDALQHGFRPIVIADACGDRDPRLQQANLFDLNAKYADVLESDVVLAWLRTLSAQP